MNALTDRYSHPGMVDLWCDHNRYTVERRLWFAILNAQCNVGLLEVDEQQLERYRASIQTVDLTEIGLIERITRHDLQARLLAYERSAVPEGDPVAGKLHWGLTSADITENTTCILIRDGLKLIAEQIGQCQKLLAHHARQHAQTPTVGRTHGQPAQLTTIGSRFGRCYRELLEAAARISDLLITMPMRGLGGAVGTSGDMYVLTEPLDRNQADVVWDVSDAVAAWAGFNSALDITGQVGYRSVDLDVVSALLQVCAAPANLALTVRLQSMLGLAAERPTREQVGSSAMPHKNNPRYSERIAGLQNIARGFHTMVAATAGNTWFEGDVSDSCVRRVALPGMFYAVSGLLRTFEHLLGIVQFDADEVDAEVREHRSEVNTGALLAYALIKGYDRATIYDCIRQACSLHRYPGSIAKALLTMPTWPQEIGEDIIIGRLTTDNVGLAVEQLREIPDPGEVRSTTGDLL